MDIPRLFGLEYSTGNEDSDVFTTDSVTKKLVVSPPDRNSLAASTDSSERKTVFTWPDVGTFHVHDGNEVTADFVDDAEPSVVRNILVGICLGALLQQRGYLVVHGSVVEVDNEAVAFVGAKRAGKSTSAAALLARGHDFLSDDIVAIRFDGETPLVVPGFPLLKFDPDTFDDTHLPAQPTADPETGFGKLYYRVEGNFDWNERPLSRICVLDPDTGTPSRERLTGHNAAMSLLEHTWPVRLRTAPYVPDDQNTVTEPELGRYTHLVETCPVQRISLEHDHETLDELGRDLESMLGANRV